MLRRAIVFALIASVGSAQEFDPESVLVEVWFSPDGTTSVSMELTGSPPNEAELKRALGTLIGATEVDASAQTYEFESDGVLDSYHYWEASAFREGEGFRWLNEFELRPQPLLDALRNAGYGSMALSVAVPKAALFECPSHFERYEWGDHTWADGLYLASAQAPVVRIRVGYPQSWMISRAALLAGLLLLPTLGGLFLRRVALRAPDEQAGYACMTTTRRYQRLIALFWFAWFVTIAEAEPIQFLLYGWPNQWTIYFSDWMIDPFALLSLAAVLPAKPLLFPVYRRFPGATWQRRDFFMQGLWFNLMILATIVLLAAFIRAAVNMDIVSALAWTVFGLIAVFLLYMQYLSSLGLVPQSVTEGELRDRIDELARKAGLPRINDVNVVYFTKAPLPNAFAANGLRVMVTDFLLKTLTKREVDAIVAHELGHLRAKHPQKLMFWMLVALVPVVLAAVIIASGGLIPLLTTGFTERALITAFALGFPAGLFARYALARRYESEADAAAIAITGDPESLITGLAKITRLNYMPLVGSRWGESLSTHPSTQRRIERIAELSQFRPDRVTELLSGESVDSDYYSIPASSELSRVFSSRTRARVIRRIWLFSLAIGVIGPWLGMYTSLQWSGASPPLFALGAAVATAAVSIVFHELSAVASFRAMRGRLVKRLQIEPSEHWRYVGFSPNERMHLYDGFTNWDIGFLRLTSEGIEYRGDAVSLKIPGASIKSIDLLGRYESRWAPARRTRVAFLSSEADRVFLFEAAGAWAMFDANRKTASLYRELIRWHDEARNQSVVPAQDIPALEVRGKPLADYISPRRYFGGVSLFLLLSTGAGAGLPAPEGEAFTYIVWTQLTAVLAYALAYFPMVFVRRRDEDYPAPPPEHDPFERNQA